MSASLLDRVRKLIALSASDREEEARTSAFLACKLIRENGFAVTLPVTAAPRAAVPPPKYTTRPASPVDHETIARAAREGVCGACGMRYYYRARVVRQAGAWVHLKCWRHS